MTQPESELPKRRQLELLQEASDFLDDNRQDQAIRNLQRLGLPTSTPKETISTNIARFFDRGREAREEPVSLSEVTGPGFSPGIERSRNHEIRMSFLQDLESENPLLHAALVDKVRADVQAMTYQASVTYETKRDFWHHTMHVDLESHSPVSTHLLLVKSARGSSVKDIAIENPGLSRCFNIALIYSSALSNEDFGNFSVTPHLFLRDLQPGHLPPLGPDAPLGSRINREIVRAIKEHLGAERQIDPGEIVPGWPDLFKAAMKDEAKRFNLQRRKNGLPEPETDRYSLEQLESRYQTTPIPLAFAGKSLDWRAIMKQIDMSQILSDAARPEFRDVLLMKPNYQGSIQELHYQDSSVEDTSSSFRGRSRK